MRSPDPGRLEALRAAAPEVERQLPQLLREVESSWHSADFLPDFQGEAGMEQLRRLREEAAALDEDTLTVLIGDMITEEALPTYAGWLHRMGGAGDELDSESPWRKWIRGWCAEENRHGEVLNRYLYLCGRVNMKEVEISIQHLIRDGGDTETGTDPFRGFIYTSFQEMATRVSHLNVARRARERGAELLYTVCSRVAGDEHRHARAYTRFISLFLELDPNGVLVAFEDMMRRRIVMPARFLRERGGAQGDAFRKFETVATRAGVYTPWDYVRILESLLEAWRVPGLSGLNEAGRWAQDYLCGLPERLRRVIPRLPAPPADPVPFRWFLPPGAEPAAEVAAG